MKSIHRFLQHVLLVWFCLCLSILATGCGPKKYSFTIDAPPAYANEYSFKQMKIEPFQSNRRPYGRAMQTLLASRIAREGYVTIVKNGQDCVLAGHVTIGKVHENYRSESYECTKYRDGKSYKSTCYTYYCTKKMMANADYTLLAERDGGIVFGDSVAYDFEKTWSSRKSRADVRADALTADQIIDTAMQTMATAIVGTVTPHKETVKRELQEGSDDNIALGITYLENGRVDQAIAIWDQCIDRASSVEDKAAALYNIGVITESRGAYRDAFELYSRANSLMPAEVLYIQSMTRAEELNRKMEKLRNWSK